MLFSMLTFNIAFNVPMWTVSLCTLPRWHGTKGFKYLPIALGWNAFIVKDRLRSSYGGPYRELARERLVYYSPLYHTIRYWISDRLLSRR